MPPILLLTVALAGLFAAPVAAGQATTPSATQSPPLAATIDELGSFDYTVRTAAARAIRRMPAATSAPALERAARSHADEYVRFRALVLLSGADGRTAASVMRDMIDDRNDRIRTVVFQWYAHYPDPTVLAALIAALPGETSEFVRPALTRALAAYGEDARAREVLVPLVRRGEDSFRGAVIEALGDFGARYALADIAEVARLDGPLQDDAITAIGRIGDASMRATLATLRATAEDEIQPTLAASLCLLGVECEKQVAYLRETLAFVTANAGYQPLLRGVVHALSVLAERGRPEALEQLFDAGDTADEALRAPITLGVGLVAFRSPGLLLKVLGARPDPGPAVELIGEAFEMLSEDFEEERAYAEFRRAYWAAAEGSPARAAIGSLIERLEF